VGAERILEWCAELFGATVRSRLGQLVLFCLALFALGVFLAARWGYAAWALPALAVAFAVSAARQVGHARNEVWRAACLSLDQPGQRPRAGRVLAPTAASLLRLAEAVDAVRRGRYEEAEQRVPHIERHLLRPEELQLLDAVRAMVSMGLGSTGRAAQQAVTALPTGCEDLDTCLGRTVVDEAWNDPGRLGAIERAWQAAGVEEGPLSRLRGLVRIRLDAGQLDTVETAKARELSDEARAIGDDELASELDARSKAAYR
jgi:hypothetical protein